MLLSEFEHETSWAPPAVSGYESAPTARSLRQLAAGYAAIGLSYYKTSESSRLGQATIDLGTGALSTSNAATFLFKID